MEVKSGYKQTEVGVIPKDWDVARLGDVCKIFGRIGFRGYTIDDIVEKGKGAIAISPSNIRDSRMDFTDCTYISWFKYEESPEIKIYNGDILLVKTGSTFGKTAIVRNLTENATLNPQVVVLKKPKLDSFFLGYMMSFHTIQSQISSAIVGGALPTLSQNLLAQFNLPFPPSEAEQTAIGGALGDVDALLDALEKLIAKKRNLKQAAMQQLLTGQTRLPGFSGEWEVKRITEIATPSSERNTAGDNLPVLTCSKHFGFMDSLGFFKNQVFSKDLSAYKVIRRGQIGYPANHVEEGSVGLQNLYDIALVSPIYVVFSVAEHIDSFFLHRLLKLDSYRQKFKTATTSSVERRGSLRWRAFSEITVRLPTLPEQTAIAEVLSDMDAEIAALEQRLVKTRALKQGMMQELLTGRVRLI
jgi:type I restriction enzyme S subunit